HITGNVVVIADQLVNGGSPHVAQLAAVPVFAGVVLGVCAVARVAGVAGSRTPLLVAQSLLLLLVLGLALRAHAHHGRPTPEDMTLAVLVAVAAMAVQNAFLRVSLDETSTTSVMTGNVASTMIALASLVLGGPWPAAEAPRRLRRTLPLLIGFFLGCALGAATAFRFGAWAWGVPAVLSFLAVPLATRLPGS